MNGEEGADGEGVDGKEGLGGEERGETVWYIIINDKILFK